MATHRLLALLLALVVVLAPASRAFAQATDEADEQLALEGMAAKGHAMAASSSGTPSRFVGNTAVLKSLVLAEGDVVPVWYNTVGAPMALLGSDPLLRPVGGLPFCTTERSLAPTKPGKTPADGVPGLKPGPVGPVSRRNDWLQMWSGDRVSLSPLLIEAGIDLPCSPLCRGADGSSTVKATRSESSLLSSLVKSGHRAEWVIAGKPVFSRHSRFYGNSDLAAGVELGIPLGRLEKGFPVLFNHFDLKVYFHPESLSKDKTGLRVLGVEAVPRSIDQSHGFCPHDRDESMVDADSIRPQPVLDLTSSPKKRADETPPTEVLAINYSYSVRFVKTTPAEFVPVARALASPPVRLAHSLQAPVVPADASSAKLLGIGDFLAPVVIVGFGFMIFRSMREESERYNSRTNIELQEKDGSAAAQGLVLMIDDPSASGQVGGLAGWRLIHGDVFRPPRRRGWLVLLISTAIQLATTGIFLTACLVLLSISGDSLSEVLYSQTLSSHGSRLAILGATACAFIVLSAVANYHGSRVHKFFIHGTAAPSSTASAASKGPGSWSRQAVINSLTIPAGLMVAQMFVNLAASLVQSSSRIPLRVVLGAFGAGLVMAGALPFGLAGAYFGRKKAVLSTPVRTNRIPRPVPVAPLLWGRIPLGPYTVALAYAFPLGLYMWGALARLHSGMVPWSWFPPMVSWEYALALTLWMGTLIGGACLAGMATAYHCWQTENYFWWWPAALAPGCAAAMAVMLHCVTQLVRVGTATDLPGQAAAVVVILFRGVQLLLLLCPVAAGVGVFAAFQTARWLFSTVRVE
ncbi:hypothetical protein H696_02573 [Fonticula alba]|uniref:Transmembrane 9 superfamily member n=1 Tax=Fonticula alba TaxID=691883 RepID=A0A058Z8J2_FONAL|nr:hypothetical protein H696_02573 [Fonticula alba]KCV70243.1 hypothetical protein H696_02573 [Fonticula alba]|eukprot:XP_009494759.1 hypothetical protein H696_02573 [Fonticula alba]